MRTRDTRTKHCYFSCYQSVASFDKSKLMICTDSFFCCFFSVKSDKKLQICWVYHFNSGSHVSINNNTGMDHVTCEASDETVSNSSIP
jgi:hypothetical protein